MIFKPELVEKILAGEKTVTRRPVKPGNSLHGPDWRPCKYKVGRDYAVQPGRGKKAVARIRIKDVRRGALGRLEEAEARREGFGGMAPDYPPTDEFEDYWTDLYGSYDSTQLVDRIEFELVRDTEGDR